MSFTLVPYESLNARQKELRNFHKIAARLADYGFHSMWLSDDWQGADFLACHIDGATVLRVQLKARMVLDRKYLGKGLHIAFREGDRVFVYPHDELAAFVDAHGLIGEGAQRYHEHGVRHWPVLPGWAVGFLVPHEVKAPAP